MRRRQRTRMLEDRVAALESRARWQEAALNHLGMVLGDQAVRLSRASVRIDELEDQLRAAIEPFDFPPRERPDLGPH